MARITLPSGARRTYAASLRAVEVAAFTFASWLAGAYIALDSHTVSGAVDLVRDQANTAGGAALVALIGSFGLSRSKLKNLSPVVAPGKPADVAEHPHESGDSVATDA